MVKTSARCVPSNKTGCRVIHQLGRQGGALPGAEETETKTSDNKERKKIVNMESRKIRKKKQDNQRQNKRESNKKEGQERKVKIGTDAGKKVEKVEKGKKGIGRKMRGEMTSILKNMK